MESPKGQQMRFILPDTFLSVKMPLQGDGIWNSVCDGEFTHFDGRRQHCALWKRSGVVTFCNGGKGITLTLGKTAFMIRTLACRDCIKEQQMVVITSATTFLYFTWE